MNEKSLKRRVRLVTIDSNRILNLIARKNPSQFILVEEFDLPDDCKVISVHLNYAMAAHVFVIQSETFEEVEECIVPPEHPVKSRTVELAVKETTTT